MREYLTYIKNNFPKELQLIILLSQDKPDKSEISSLVKNMNWNLFIDLVLKHRMVSHIYKYSQLLEEFIPSEVVETIKQFKLDQSGKSLSYTAFLIQIHQHLVENTIPHCFFKGPLLSLELYQDVGFRNFGDIDILVEKKNVEKAKQIIESLGFSCIYPRIKLTDRQRKINYTLSHHYHFKHQHKNSDIELHWSITNPQSFFGKNTSEIIENTEKIKITNIIVPYISKIDNLVFLAAHGSIHQWYRLFWLKDFSVLLSKTNLKDLEMAFILSKSLKLEKCFLQACQMSHIIYKTEMPSFLKSTKKEEYLIQIPLKSIYLNELKQQGLKGKFMYVFYRLKLKPSIKYYFDLIYRLRTHLSDWETLKIPNRLFFLYYIFRPFLLIYKHFSTKH
ncbi:MAG: nucleotidyltransferase family protein [Bacteroidales bacterium]